MGQTYSSSSSASSLGEDGGEAERDLRNERPIGEDDRHLGKGVSEAEDISPRIAPRALLHVQSCELPDLVPDKAGARIRSVRVSAVRSCSDKANNGGLFRITRHAHLRSARHERDCWSHIVLGTHEVQSQVGRTPTAWLRSQN